MIRRVARWALGALVTAESLAAYARHDRRTRLFYDAARRAQELGRPLVVIGDPDAGMHTRLIRAYGCGDVCVDLHGCPMCPVVRAADITRGPIPGLADDSAVVFVSCVLEYVRDLQAALAEIRRIAGDLDNLYIVTVQPWTLTAALYPGARWAGIAERHVVTMAPVTTGHKLLAAGLVGGALALALLPKDRRP